MSITGYENLISTAERRSLLNGETQTAVRFSDLMGMIPSITGKVELVYEGEQEGSDFVANHLISEATKTLFLMYFPKIEKLKKPNQTSVYDAVIDWSSSELLVSVTSARCSWRLYGMVKGGGGGGIP